MPPGSCAKHVFALDVPGIHVLLYRSKENVDGRDKPGHDERTVTIWTYNLPSNSRISRITTMRPRPPPP
jgi:hypothetical protein